MPEPAYTPAYATSIARALGAGAVPQPGDIPTTVEEAEKVFNDFIGYSGGPVVHLTKHVQTATRKIILINDLHVPFHNSDALAQIIREHAEDTYILILGGDLVDLFGVSRYDKYKQHFSLEEELRSGKAVLNLLASRFRKVILLSGNHDERWKKHLVRRGFGPSELAALNILAQEGSGDLKLDVTDPLNCFARKLDNVELVAPVRLGYAEFGFFTQVGDVVISHAEKFSRIPGQAANAALLWFMSNGIPSGLVKPFRVLCQTHTHQAGMHYGNYGIWTMECGCLCYTPDYAADPKLRGAQRPSVLGYTIIYQDENGRTDMTRTRFVPIEG
jgi:hypothetical protein